jgi:probable phosphoglycerate mutase
VTAVSESAGPPGELWLVRHGETEWSATGRHTSRTDVDLTPAGVVAAREVAGRLPDLPWARVLTSPRLRARRTATLAGFPDADVVEDLVEWDYGADEGRTTPEIREGRPGWTVWADGPADGESADEVGRRADRVVGLVRTADGPVLAFSHGHLSRALGARWVGEPVGFGARLGLSTAAVSVLGWERDTPVIERWNDTGPLR